MASDKKAVHVREVRTAPFGPPRSLGNWRWNTLRWPFSAIRVSSYSERDPRKFYWLDKPKFNGSLQDAVPGESNFFYGWEDEWQSGPSVGQPVMDHGMDGYGYWYDEELGPENHAWPDVELKNVSTGFECVQAEGGMPGEDSVNEINKPIFLYNVGHSTIGRALQDNPQKPGHDSDKSSFGVEGGEEVANYAVREWETNNDTGVVGYSGWYYPEGDSGTKAYASWDIKHAYVMYQGSFSRRIDPGGVDWFCKIFKRWPSCRDPDNPAGHPDFGPGSGLIGRILDKILNGFGRQSRSCASSVFDVIEQEDGSKFIPTEFGDFRKPKDGEWTWTWPDDLDICIEVGDNVWRKKFAHMLYGCLSNMLREYRYDDLFNDLSRNDKLMFIDALMPIWGPTCEEGIKQLIIALSYAGAPATPKDGEVSVFDNGVHGSCAQEFRTSIFKPGAWGRDKLSGPGIDAYNNTISSYDVAWADWKGFAKHKQKYPAHHRSKADGGGIARSACGSYPSNFKGHPADERKGSPDGPRCMQFIEWFGQDVDSKAVKKLHDMFFPHHLNNDGTTNKWCDCYEQGTPKWDAKTGIGQKGREFSKYSLIPKGWKKTPYRGNGTGGTGGKTGSYPRKYDDYRIVGGKDIDPNANIDFDNTTTDDDEIRRQLEELNKISVDRNKGERLQDVPGLTPVQLIQAKIEDAQWDAEQEKKKRKQEKLEEINRRLREAADDKIPGVDIDPDGHIGDNVDIDNFPGLFPEGGDWENWTLNDLFEEIENRRDPDGDPLLPWEEIMRRVEERLQELLPNQDIHIDIHIPDYINIDSGGFDWPRFQEDFMRWLRENLPDMNIDIGGNRPGGPNRPNLPDFNINIIDIINNFDPKKIIKKLLKKLLGEAMPPFIPGVIGKIIDAILLIIGLMGTMDDLASGLELTKSIDWIAEMKPNGANNRGQWGNPNRTDYRWDDHKPNGFMSGVISFEAQQLVHFFDLEANGMLIHMGGNSDTGLISDGVGRTKKFRLMNFAPIYSPTYGRLSMFNGLKVLNHYGFKDPAQHSWDDWFQIDTRDDNGPNAYKVSKSTQTEQTEPTYTEKRRVDRVVNDNRLSFEEFQEIINSDEPPNPKDMPQAEQGLARRSVHLPKDWKPHWEDANGNIVES